MFALFTVTEHTAQEMLRHDQIGEILDQRQQKDARQLNQVNVILWV